MPKTKEQKQLEALERQGKSVLPSALQNFIANMPGGGLFQRSPSNYDMQCVVESFMKYREACRMHGFAIPERNDTLPNVTYSNSLGLLRQWTTVAWIGSLTEVCDRARKEQGLTPIAEALNKAGAERDLGIFTSINDEVEWFKRSLREYTDALAKVEYGEIKKFPKNMAHGGSYGA